MSLTLTVPIAEFACKASRFDETWAAVSVILSVSAKVALAAIPVTDDKLRSETARPLTVKAAPCPPVPDVDGEKSALDSKLVLAFAVVASSVNAFAPRLIVPTFV